MNLFNILATGLCKKGSDLEPLFELIGKAFQLILIAIPIILVIFGTIDLGKAVMAGKDDEIKAAQKMLMKRIIYTLLAFLLLGIIKAVVKLVVTDESSEVIKCFNLIFK